VFIAYSRSLGILVTGALLITVMSGCGRSKSSPPSTPPVISNLTAVPRLVEAGTATTITTYFQNGAGTLQPGNYPVTSGVPITMTLTATTEFVLEVRSSSVEVEARTSIQVVPPANYTLAFYAGTPTGTGTWDGPGSQARFNGLLGVAIDPQGNTFVADSANHSIRKVSPAGIVSTFAGIPGKPGSVDGPGYQAQFSLPTAIAADRTGFLYVSDGANNTIRKITPEGLVTTLAGSPGVPGTADGMGSKALFHYPQGLAVDAMGNVIVADYWNCTIRTITPGGVVQTLAGSPLLYGSVDGQGAAARFWNPMAVCVDTEGNVFVADYVNQAIRKVTPSGLVTTLAGSLNTPGYADGPVQDARFNGPSGIAVDGAGNLYVADKFNHVIRRIDSSGGVSTLAGSPGVQGSDDGPGSTAQFNQPNNIACSPDGGLLVADTGNNALRAIASDGRTSLVAGLAGTRGNRDGPGTLARFSGPLGVCLGPSGVAFVADSYNHTIRKISPTGEVTTFAGAPGLSGYTDGLGSAARFWYPVGLAAEADGALLVADSQNHVIRKVDPSGLVTTLAGIPGLAGSADGPALQATFSAPSGVAVDATGNIYVSDTGNNTIRLITRAGLVKTVAGTAKATPRRQLGMCLSDNYLCAFKGARRSRRF